MPGISKMKNLIIVTGGAGFVGSNLIKSLLKKTNKKIICLDNYSSGNKKNHIRDARVKYLSNCDATLAPNDPPIVIPRPFPIFPFSMNSYFPSSSLTAATVSVKKFVSFEPS